MQPSAAFRPYITAGVAVVGASLIAVTPVISNDLEHRAVALTGVIDGAVMDLSGGAAATTISDAVVNPITNWIDVFGTAFDNLGGIAQGIIDDPFPVLQQIMVNQQGYVDIMVPALQKFGTAFYDWLTNIMLPGLQTGFQEMLAGQPAAGVQTILDAGVELFYKAGLKLVPMLQIPNDMTAHLASVVKALTNAFSFLLPLVAKSIQPPYALATGWGDSAQAFVDAMNAGDPLGALSAIVNTPADMVGGFLNGVPNTWYGLLGTPANAGLLWELLVNIPQTIAHALGANSAAAATVVAGSVVNPADLVTSTSAVAELSSLSTGLTGMLDLPVLSADVSSMLAGLSGDLAAMFNPAALAGLLPF